MANKSLFKSAAPSMPPNVFPTDTVNEAGGAAYSFTNEHAFLQYLLTGCLSNTYYATDEEQLKKVIELAGKCSLEFVAKAATYARERGYMKDMPALALTYLAAKKSPLLSKVFPRVVDSPKMVRNFVQMIRSGALGRKSLGSAPKRRVEDYLNGLSDEQLFRADVGTAPSIPDIIKMVHPHPKTPEREALYGYLLGLPSKEAVVGKTRTLKDGKVIEVKGFDRSKLVGIALEYEAFKTALLAASTDAEKNRLEPPNVPFLMLTALPLTEQHWKRIAERATWQQVRMNLNTFARHGVFQDEQLTQKLALKIQNPEEIRRAKVFPYQLFTAFSYVDETVPMALKLSLQSAADIAIDNVPTVEGYVVVCPDVSGSMRSPVTGVRSGSTSKVTCIDVAALVAASILRKNPLAEILPFEGDVVDIKRLGLNPRDSVMTNAQKLASVGGGSTECSAPLRLLNARRARVDAVVFVSDNESWVQPHRPAYGWSGRTGATSMMGEWTALQDRNPKAKMVCIDIQANASTQAHARKDILNIGGFSDAVFDVLAAFLNGDNNPSLVDVVNKIEL